MLPTPFSFIWIFQILIGYSKFLRNAYLGIWETGFILIPVLCYHEFCLLDLFLYVQANNFSVIWDRSSWGEPVLSKDLCPLLMDTMQ